jgi:Tol biopolymer transport system component
MDLQSGSLRAVAASPMQEQEAFLDPSGESVLYQVLDRTGPELARRLAVVNASGGPPRTVTADSGGPLMGWSPRRKAASIRRGLSLYLVNTDTGESQELLRAEAPPFGAVFSHDDQWMLFYEAQPGGGTRAFAVPLTRDYPVQREHWVQITEGKHSDGHPKFSPDDSLVYFVSNRDGFQCLWARRVDPATKVPQTDAFPVFHSHDPALSMSNLDNRAQLGLAMTKDRIYLCLGERKGNIWLLEPMN